MNKKLLLLLIIFCPLVSSQIETVPAEHPVYQFIKKMSVLGVITYDDAVLPFSRSEIVNLLDSASKYKDNLSFNDRGLLLKFSDKLRIKDKSARILTDDFEVFTNTEKVLYRFQDSSVTFTLNPVLDLTSLYSIDTKKSSSLINAGGRVYGSFDNWLGFSVQASNGVVTGDRNTAMLDYRIARSFTFQDTEINFFDATEGHLILKKGIAAFQIGREKILWGSGYIDRMLISNNPPIFDFLRFSLSYKALKYDFLHGWLVQKPESVYIDSLIRNIKTKAPKYIAVNRLGISLSKNINAGISQTVIYSGRPVEAAYLNPFILWESSQRSLNDLDNSFLSFDIKWKITDGLETNFSYLLDDVHFGRLFENGWNIVDNKIALQAGMYFVPEVVPDLDFQFEFSLIRPYTFSHAGVNEALTYTNNGFFLGIPIHPNSVKYSMSLNYSFNPDLSLKFNLSYLKHGNNVYTEDGKVKENYGGNIFEYQTLYDPSTAYLLDGQMEKDFFAGFRINWEFIRDYYLIVDYNYNELNSLRNETYSFISAQVRLFFE